MNPFTPILYHIAVFFDDNGRYIGSKKLDYKNKTFTFMNRSYIFRPSSCSFFNSNNFMFYKRFYFYSLNNSEPLFIKKTYTPVLDPKDFHSLLKSDLIEKLNNLKESWFSKLLNNPIFWIVVVVLLVGGYWIYSHGGKLW